MRGRRRHSRLSSSSPPSSPPSSSRDIYTFVFGRRPYQHPSHHPLLTTHYSPNGRQDGKRPTRPVHRSCRGRGKQPLPSTENRWPQAHRQAMQTRNASNPLTRRRTQIPYHFTHCPWPMAQPASYSPFHTPNPISSIFTLAQCIQRLVRSSPILGFAHPHPILHLHR